MLFNISSYPVQHYITSFYVLFLANLIIFFIESINFLTNLYFFILINLTEVFMRYLELDYYEFLPTFYFNSPHPEKNIVVLEGFMTI